MGAGLAGPAAAEEQLEMPFACRVAGGQVMLAPSAPQTYQIYGSREQRRLTTCSPYDPRKCHNWSVHRFDLNCGGVRTSWESVVAALAPMLQDSLGSIGDARPYDGLAYAPPGRARPGRGEAVSFPPGFAPNPMKVARFSGSSTPAPAPLPVKKPQAPAPEPSEVAALEPSPEPTPTSMPAIPPMPESDLLASKDSAAKAADTAPTPPAAPETKTTEVAGYRSLKVELDSEVTGALPKTPASGSLWRDAATVFMWPLAVLFAVSATLLLGRRKLLERLPMPTSFLLLRGPARPPALREPEPEPDPEAVRQKEATANRLRLWDEDWLPRTTLEALDVLGVDPDISRDKMKTTVTRLRRALHPDHAIDEEDRLLRERRLKQINVAWDIVAGKRRVPWLKQSA
jgi:hypothetical protein